LPSIPTPKKGDRIRVSDEGTVTSVTGTTSARSRLMVKRDDGTTFFVGINPSFKPRIEILEPVYVVGGVYMDHDGDVYRYNGTANADAVWTEFSTNYDGGEEDWRDGYPARPLRRLDGVK
jgi:hypothetical protein